MTLADILAESKIFSLDIFPPGTVANVGKRFEPAGEKTGRPAIRCLVRDKFVAAKPEEIVRQLWLEHLVRFYKYDIRRLAVEYPITFGRDSSKRADIVIFDADQSAKGGKGQYFTPRWVIDMCVKMRVIPRELLDRMA